MSPWTGDQPWRRSIQVQPKPEPSSFNPIRHALPKCPGCHPCVRRVRTSIRFHFAPHLSSYLFELNHNSFLFNRLFILHGRVAGHSFPRPKPTSKTASITMRWLPTHRAQRNRAHCGANRRRRVCRSRQSPFRTTSPSTSSPGPVRPGSQAIPSGAFTIPTAAGQWSCTAPTRGNPARSCPSWSGSSNGIRPAPPASGRMSGCRPHCRTMSTSPP